MNAQFTPGPWFVSESPVLAVVCSEGQPVIAELTDQGDAVDGDQLVATARLLAAAPDLLAAAETVLAGLTNRIDAAKMTDVPVFAGIADLHASIAKARGEPTPSAQSALNAENSEMIALSRGRLA